MSLMKVLKMKETIIDVPDDEDNAVGWEDLIMTNEAKRSGVVKRDEGSVKGGRIDPVAPLLLTKARRGHSLNGVPTFAGETWNVNGLPEEMQTRYG